MLHVKYLIIGAGLAGATAAERIRALDANGTILLIGQEVGRPYHRPPLSTAYLAREIARSELTTHSAGYFSEHQIELRTGRRIEHIDASRRSVSLDGGDDISFGALLIATGAHPAPLRVPGADLPGLLHLRTVEDADRLILSIEKAKSEGRPHPTSAKTATVQSAASQSASSSLTPSRPASRGRVTVIGGGVLGVELASTFTRLGLAVDLAVKQSHPWHRFAGESVGRFITRFVEARGVRVHVNSPVARIEGDGRVQRVVLASGESIDADFAVAVLGTQPNREILRGTPIEAGNAILADQHCRTSAASIFAAGDCASVFDPRFGKHRPMRHWADAHETGRIAGNNMVATLEPALASMTSYDTVTEFATTLFGVSVRVFGDARPIHHRLSRGNPTPENPETVEFGIAADGRLAQVVVVGSDRDDALLRKMVAARYPLDDFASKLSDPSTPLADVIKI